MREAEVTYFDELKAMDCEILADQTFGDWQGSHLAIVRRGGRILVAHTYYGSCSVCDALEHRRGYGSWEREVSQETLAAWGEVDWKFYTPEEAKKQFESSWDVGRGSMVTWISDNLPSGETSDEPAHCAEEGPR